MHSGEGTLTGGQGGDRPKGLRRPLLSREGVEAPGIPAGVSDWLEEWQHARAGEMSPMCCKMKCKLRRAHTPSP